MQNLTYSPNGQNVTLNAAVADASIPGDTVGEGTVTFAVENGSTTIGTAQGTVSRYFAQPFSFRVWRR